MSVLFPPVSVFCFLPGRILPRSLHLTTFCLQYSPPVVACVCIHLACKWSNWEIPVSTDGKHWWEYVDPTVTLELLDGMCCKLPRISVHSKYKQENGV